MKAVSLLRAWPRTQVPCGERRRGERVRVAFAFATGFGKGAPRAGSLRCGTSAVSQKKQHTVRSLGIVSQAHVSQ